MGLSNIIELDPDFLFPFFYDYYYSEVFTGNQSTIIEEDTTYETIVNNVKSKFGSAANPYLYAIVPNRHTKAIIRNSCSGYSPMCIIAQVTPAPKTKKKTVINFDEIPKDYLHSYYDFLKQEENSVKEGRWGLPALDASGNKIYIVYRTYKLNGQTVISTKTTSIPDTDLEEVIENFDGSTTTYVYKPYYVKSKAHPDSTKYGYTLDLNGKKVQQTVPTLVDRVIDSRWFLHQDYKGINTIAYGHALLPEEITSNKIQISDTEYATDWINQGLTDEQAFKLLIYDYKKHEKEVRDMIEAPRWNVLPNMYRIALVDITYNGGGPRKFPKMCTAMGIPPKMGNITQYWPTIKEFKLEAVDHEEVKRQLNRGDVPNRDTNFKATFF